MKGAVTINTTSPRRSLFSSAKNVRTVNNHLGGRAFDQRGLSGHPVPDFNDRRLGRCEPIDAEPGDPDSTRTGVSLREMVGDRRP